MRWSSAPSAPNPYSGGSPVGQDPEEGHNRPDLGMATVTLSSPRKSTRFCDENTRRSPYRWRREVAFLRCDATFPVNARAAIIASRERHSRASAQMPSRMVAVAPLQTTPRMLAVASISRPLALAQKRLQKNVGLIHHNLHSHHEVQLEEAGR